MPSRSDFLGMQITHDCKAGTLKIFQEEYIEKMAERYGVDLPTGSRALTPLPHTAKLDAAVDGEEQCDPSLFRSICGALQFCSHCCRPDVSQSIKELCKHLIDPALRHYKAAQQCLSYLLATKDYGLTYTIAENLTLRTSWLPSDIFWSAEPIFWPEEPPFWLGSFFL